MRSVNKVILVGNLGKDAELKYTPSGTAVATFSLATSEVWKDDKGSTNEKTEWHTVIAWRKLAEIVAEHLKKGMKVYVEGKIQTRSWDKDGSKHYKTEIIADQILILDKIDKGAAE